jgi:hypothetical protein
MDLITRGYTQTSPASGPAISHSMSPQTGPLRQLHALSAVWGARLIAAAFKNLRRVVWLDM